MSTGDYLALADEVEANFERHVWSCWFPRAVDPSGGFHQNYTEDWTRLQPADRSVVYQSRLTWLAARCGDLGAASHGFQFLAGHLWDPDHGGFYWSLDENGTPERGGEKHVYGLSFALYAIAAHYGTSGDDSVLDLAQRCYGWLQTHAHDDVHGGWQESLTRAGKPILGPPPGRDAIGTPRGCKSMNTHIHLLESLAALYEVWPDPSVHRSLVEVFEIVRDKVLVESVGCLNLFFTPDWRALPEHDSYGHAVETAFLLVEATAALGAPDDDRTWTLARRIVDHALDYGWDTEHGGFYDSGPAYGRPTHREKVWWVQAEGLNALLLMHGRFGSDTGRYWQAFAQQWAFIQDYQVDGVHGGWLRAAAPDGTPEPGETKSDRWTECYHQGRALLNVASGLRRLALSGSPVGCSCAIIGG